MIKSKLRAALFALVLLGLTLLLNRLIIPPEEGLVLVPGVLQFRLLYNKGVAFSLFTYRPALAISLSALVLLLLCAYCFFGPVSRRERLCLAAVLAGGLSNLLERLLTGAVPDMIELLFIDFPVFNWADILVCAGALLFGVFSIFSKEPASHGTSV